MLQEELLVERDKDQKTRHQLQKSKYQDGSDRHQGPASGNGCELQVPGRHHR